MIKAAQSAFAHRREPIAPSNLPRGPPPSVGARQVTTAYQSILEPSLLSRKSNHSSRSISSNESDSANNSAASGLEAEQTFSASMASGEFFQPVSRVGSLDTERMRPGSTQSTELPTIDSSVHHPSPSSVSLPEVSNSVVTGPDGVVLSAPVLMLEAKLAAFEQQHRFMLGSLDREYHTRSVIYTYNRVELWFLVRVCSRKPLNTL